MGASQYEAKRGQWMGPAGGTRDNVEGHPTASASQASESPIPKVTHNHAQFQNPGSSTLHLYQK